MFTSLAVASSGVTNPDQDSVEQTGDPKQSGGDGEQTQTAPSDSTQSPLESFFQGMVDWIYSTDSQSEEKAKSSSSSSSSRQTHTGRNT